MAGGIISDQAFPFAADIEHIDEGEVIAMSDEEVAKNAGGRAGFTYERGWENWCRLVDRPYYPMDWNMGPGFSKTDK